MTYPRHVIMLPVVCMQCQNLRVHGSQCYCDKRYRWPGVWALVCEQRKGLDSVQTID